MQPHFFFKIWRLLNSENSFIILGSLLHPHVQLLIEHEGEEREDPKIISGIHLSPLTPLRLNLMSWTINRGNENSFPRVNRGHVVQTVATPRP